MNLGSFEWHDLPLRSIAIKEGTLELLVTPYDEEKADYVEFRLTIFDGELDLKIEGSLGTEDLNQMEVGTFQWTAEAGQRISGSVGILPAGRGYWTIGFSHAQYSLTQVT